MRTRSEVVEDRHDRLEIARDAGEGRISMVSVLAGTVVGFGTFVLLAAIVGTIGNAMVDTNNFNLADDWREIGGGALAATILTLCLSWLFGGYVAGRMARRAGAVNGLLAFLLGLCLAVGLGGLAGTSERAQDVDTTGVEADLRAAGVPTDLGELREEMLLIGLGILVLCAASAALGGAAGDAWHGRLVRRAYDPDIGAGVPVRDAGDDVRVVDRRDRAVDLRDTDESTDDTSGTEHVRDRDTVLGKGRGSSRI